MRLPLHEPSRTFLLSCWIPAQFMSAPCASLLPRVRIRTTRCSITTSASWGIRVSIPRAGCSGRPAWAWTASCCGRSRSTFHEACAPSTAGQSPGRRRLVIAGTFASRCACVGLVGLALIPQYPGLDPAHQLAGVLAMGGLYVALWIFAGILICSPPISLAKTLLFGLALGWGPVGFLLTQGWRFFVYGELGHDVTVSSAVPAAALLAVGVAALLLPLPRSASRRLALPDPRRAPKAAHPSRICLPPPP